MEKYIPVTIFLLLFKKKKKKELQAKLKFADLRIVILF